MLKEITLVWGQYGKTRCHLKNCGEKWSLGKVNVKIRIWKEITSVKFLKKKPSKQRTKKFYLK